MQRRRQGGGQVESGLVGGAGGDVEPAAAQWVERGPRLAVPHLDGDEGGGCEGQGRGAEIRRGGADVGGQRIGLGPSLGHGGGPDRGQAVQHRAPVAGQVGQGRSRGDRLRHRLRGPGIGPVHRRTRRPRRGRIGRADAEAGLRHGIARREQRRQKSRHVGRAAAPGGERRLRIAQRRAVGQGGDVASHGRRDGARGIQTGRAACRIRRIGLQRIARGVRTRARTRARIRARDPGTRGPPQPLQRQPRRGIAVIGGPAVIPLGRRHLARPFQRAGILVQQPGHAVVKVECGGTGVPGLRLDRGKGDGRFGRKAVAIFDRASRDRRGKAE